MGEQLDPKEFARARFAEPSRLQSALDVITSSATDPPIVIASLVDLVRPVAQPGARLAELGFGSGWLLDEYARAFPACELVGLDLSAGMCANLCRRLPAVNVIAGDIERLPFVDASLDAIVTCWTLYFMRDIDAALEEMKRCIRPGGVFVAATVARDNMQEYAEFAREAFARARVELPGDDVGRRFDMTSGEPYVRRHFDHVGIMPWHGELILHDPESALALWDPYATNGYDGEGYDRAFAEFEQMARDRFARGGALRVRRRSGAFVATV